MLIRNANALLNGRFVPDTDVLVRGGRIAAVGRGLMPEGGETIDLRGDYLLPGFVDVHIHGYDGRSAMEGEEAVRHMSRALKRAGVAAFLPTTEAASPEETAHAVAGIGAVMDRQEPDGAIVLGAHLEGPFLNEQRCGAMRPACFLPPSEENLARLTGGRMDAVRLITLAPELEGSGAFIDYAAARGIHVSIGHTAADAQTVHAAAARGADHVTHLFNAQSPLRHREPGVPGAALADDRLACEMICDGVHVHPDIVRLAARCKGAAKLAAITDALAVTGLPAGAYTVGGQRILLREDAAYLEDGTLCGSAITMAQAFRNLIAFGIPPEDAAVMATKTPARSVGCRDAGVIREGALGVFAWFDQAFAFVRTIG